MTAPEFESAPYDPLVALEGSWTTDLAERHLPIPNAPPARYECWDGKLIMTPRLGTDPLFATWMLGRLLEAASTTAGHRLHRATDLRHAPRTLLIEPILVVSTLAPDGCRWIPAEDVLLVGESVPPSHTSGVPDTLELCTTARIPYYLRLEASYTSERIDIDLFRLADGTYVRCASARDGEIFETETPFPLSFTPDELLAL